MQMQAMAKRIIKNNDSLVYCIPNFVKIKVRPHKNEMATIIESAFPCFILFNNLIS